MSENDREQRVQVRVDRAGNVVVEYIEDDVYTGSGDSKIVDSSQTKNIDISIEKSSNKPGKPHGFFTSWQKEQEPEPAPPDALAEETSDHIEEEKGGMKRKAFGILWFADDGRISRRRSIVRRLFPEYHEPRIFEAVRITFRKFENHTSRRVRYAYEGARFTSTFTGAFAILFIALNFGSYWQLMHASLMPDAHKEASIALRVMTNPVLREELLDVPELPEAGSLGVAIQKLDVWPPDDRLIVPKIAKNIPIIHASDAALRRKDWGTFNKDIHDALRFGVVHYPGTAVPGQIGNVFVTGHSSYQPWDPGRYKDVFALLSTLEIGDEYSMFYNGNLHTYRITEKYEVKPTDVSVLDQPEDVYMSTLMTCTPVGTNLRRLVLRAKEIDVRTGEFILVQEEPSAVTNIDDWGNELIVW